MDWKNFMTAGGAGGIGMLAGGLGQMFGGWKNPADKANPYFDKARNEIGQGYDPWIKRGTDLANDPGGKLNEIGKGYHQSPGFEFALKQALQGAGHASAAGGMAGSPQHEMQNMGIATGMADQDYNQWMSNALGLHNLGYTQGQSAGIGKGQDMASLFGNQAQLNYEGQNAKNQHSGGMWGSLLGGIGSIAGAFL